jgi:hypothetical protein
MLYVVVSRLSDYVLGKGMWDHAGRDVSLNLSNLIVKKINEKSCGAASGAAQTGKGSALSHLPSPTPSRSGLVNLHNRGIKQRTVLFTASVSSATSNLTAIGRWRASFMRVHVGSIYLKVLL